MTVQELIDKLMLIENRDMLVYQLCPNCKGYFATEDMRDMGFVIPSIEVKNEPN